MKEELVEMKASNKTKIEFDSMQLDIFWCAQLNTFPHLAKNFACRVVKAPGS